MHDELSQLRALYVTVGPSLLARLQRWLRDTHAAEDSLQETFLQAARRPERIREVTSPRAWLFAIARNVAVTALRRQRRALRLPEDVPQASPREDPRVAQVQAAVAQLPAAHRAALELRLRDELSYEEIAVVLQIPVGTVRSRLHYAVRELRAKLAPEGD